MKKQNGASLNIENRSFNALVTDWQ